MRRHRSDLSQAAIVEALRAAGAFVWHIGEPVDLLVWAQGRWTPMECKTGKRKRKDQPGQDAFLKAFSVPVVRTPEEALTAMGLTHD